MGAMRQWCHCASCRSLCDLHVILGIQGAPMRETVGQLIHLGQDVLYAGQQGFGHLYSLLCQSGGQHHRDHLMHYVSGCPAVLPATCAEVCCLHRVAQGCQH